MRPVRRSAVGRRDWTRWYSTSLELRIVSWTLRHRVRGEEACASNLARHRAGEDFRVDGSGHLAIRAVGVVGRQASQFDRADRRWNCAVSIDALSQ